MLSLSRGITNSYSHQVYGKLFTRPYEITVNCVYSQPSTIKASPMFHFLFISVANWLPAHAFISFGPQRQLMVTRSSSKCLMEKQAQYSLHI